MDRISNPNQSYLRQSGLGRGCVGHHGARGQPDRGDGALNSQLVAVVVIYSHAANGDTLECDADRGRELQEQIGV